MLLRPLDLAAGLGEEMQRQLSEWKSVVAPPADPEVQSVMPTVLRAIYLMGRRRAFSEEEYREALAHEGMPATLAAQLASFLPSAATRVLMKGKVQFCEDYLLTNSWTNRAVRRRYDGTPVFAAGFHAFEEFVREGVAPYETWTIANSSAEMNGISQIMAKEGNLEGASIALMIVKTLEPVEGEDLDAILARFENSRQPRNRPEPARPWWKIW